VLAAIDDFVQVTEKRLMTIGPNKGSFISQLIHDHKPSTVIELGGFVGYSAILLAMRCVQPAGNAISVWRLTRSMRLLRTSLLSWLGCGIL
jgi:predicted O-methyltransferase YrrM